MVKTIQILFLIFIGFLFSCKKEEKAGCFKSTGTIQKELRSLESFSELELYDNINVILIEGIENKVEVEAGKNLIPGIKTKVENGKLTIENINTCNFMRSYKIPVNVYLTYNSLRTFTHYGGGKVTNQDTLRKNFYEFIQWFGSGDFDLNISADTLEALLHTGSGNLTLNGKLNYAYLYSSGNSIFHCENLKGLNVHINNNTTGNFYVHAVNNLIVEVYSNSTTYYKGNPTLTIIREGSGQVIPF